MTVISILETPTIHNFLKTYFEKISLAYHGFFVLFLSWLIFVRDKSTMINENFVRFLGSYVMCYGFIIFYFGPRLMNYKL